MLSKLTIEQIIKLTMTRTNLSFTKVAGHHHVMSAPDFLRNTESSLHQNQYI